jgi:indolepyruvate ferredoxin oxidoreductase
MLQHGRDRAAGHDTGGYITGYRGSPLGGYDQQLKAARRFLDRHQVVFQPGVNEDLAAGVAGGREVEDFSAHEHAILGPAGSPVG